MPDSLLEDDPRIQEIKAQAMADGELVASRVIFVKLVQKRFPDLFLYAARLVVERYLNLASDATEQIKALQDLIEEIALASDEQEARPIVGAPRKFDPIFEEDPWVKALATYGLVRGRLVYKREFLVNVVNLHFPSLSDFLTSLAEKIEQPEVLDALADQIMDTTDENIVRELLENCSVT